MNETVDLNEARKHLTGDEMDNLEWYLAVLDKGERNLYVYEMHDFKHLIKKIEIEKKRLH